VRAWTERLKEQAKAALGAIRGGATLEDATADFGAPRRDIVVTRENFPGYWRGDERLNSLLFAQPPGGVLPEPVPADHGWLLVRVEERTPAHLAPLAEVARRIRFDLRERAQRQSEDASLRPAYEAMKDSLRTNGYRVRYAVADTAALKPREPSTAELERYYRSHLADYSSYDPATTSVRARPFAEVKAEVRERRMREQRIESAREIIAGIAEAWRKGKRDRSFESRATLLREVGPVLLGAPADSGLAGRALGDSLMRRRGAPGVGAGPSPRGPMAFHVYEVIPGYIPSYEQARGIVAAHRQKQRDREELEGARALYDQDPMRFAGLGVLHLTRVTVSPPDILDVRLTRAEVERYHQEHLDRYSAPETVRARHILVSPSDQVQRPTRRRAPAPPTCCGASAPGGLRCTGASVQRRSPDARERRRAGELRARRDARGIRARRLLAARGGDQRPRQDQRGLSHHPVHLPRECGRAASGMDVPERGSGPGARAFREGQPDAADSLWLVAGTPAKMRAAARKLHLEMVPMQHNVGNRGGLPHLADVLARLETMKPGEMYPGPHKAVGKDFAFSWVDSFAPPRKPSWEDAKDQAVEVYRQGAGERALEAKVAELDSLERRGFGFDSLGALWGGLQKVSPVEPGKGIHGLGAASQVDSLVYGDGRPAALAPGQISTWLALPAAETRVRLDQRTPRTPRPWRIAWCPRAAWRSTRSSTVISRT
jgi:hypothetical protein